MAAEPWKPRFWERMKILHDSALTARCLLSVVPRQLASPVRAVDEELELRLLTVSQLLLATLIVFTNSMEAVSVCNLHSNDDEEQRALNITAARTHVKSEYDLVVSSLGHLWAAASLIGHPRIPDVVAYIDAESLAAVADVEAAMEEAVRIDVLTSPAAASADAFLAGAGN